MDDRQQQDQVQVGAGLHESRLNTDLINFLERWGTHILAVVAVLVLGYVGWQRYGIWQDNLKDKAFSAYEAARGTTGNDGVLTGNPENLLLVADDHEGRASIWELAKLDAADIWLGSAVRGLTPGTDLNNITEQDWLTDEKIDEYLNKAQTNYADVLARVEGKDAKILFELRALDGLAAVAESMNMPEEARNYLERLRDRAAGKYDRTATIAQATLDSMGEIPSDFAIVPESDLPASATPSVVIRGQPGERPEEFREFSNPIEAPIEGPLPSIGDEDDGSEGG